MDINKENDSLSTDGETLLPPWLFQHQDLINHLESSRRIDQKNLINILNHIHFMDSHISVYFSHPKYKEEILLKASPDPCMGGEVTCRWLDKTPSELKLADYQFRYLIIIDGPSIILAPGRIQQLNETLLTVQLPDTSHVLDERKNKRYDCYDILAKVIQGGFIAKGKLVDFSPLGFRIRISHDSSSFFNWFNTGVPVTIHLLQDGKQMFFSGPCLCIHQASYLSGREIVFAPAEDKITRFKQMRIRSTRHQLVPPPNITFKHPFFKKRIQRKIHNISNSGFSIHEKIDEGVLIPGLIIPELTINYAGALKMKCKAQVIYRQENEKKVRCGFAILDMDIKTYNKLTQILSHTADNYNYISNPPDMDALWKFFFDTGFIYPEKYKFIQSYREDFKKTYRKLYQDNQEIAVHFTYEMDGQIYGHIAMIRAYERTWLIHHNAAIPMGNKLTGFLILRQIMQYLTGLHRLPSAKMDYAVAYFQPKHRIASRIFGGFTSDLDNPRGCSLDIFSYLVFPKTPSFTELPAGWTLTECSNLDLWNLDLFYKHHSGGLLIDALDLKKEYSYGESLEEAYGKLGLCRKLKTYSLKHEGNLTAILIVNQSDTGINLSELLNGIKIIVTDQEHLPWDILSSAISRLTETYSVDKVPLLIYPSQYLEKENISPEKQYQFWILNLHHSGHKYLEYMERRFRIKHR